MLTISKIAPILSTDSAGWVWLNSDDKVTLCAYRWFPEIAEQRALMVSENNWEQGFWVSVHLYRKSTNGLVW